MDSSRIDGVFMKLKLQNILCKECLQKVNDIQQAEAARKKLKKNKNADDKAKNNWKKLIARGMVAQPTRSEEQMKDLLLSVDFPFEQQKQIGPYIVDFYLPPQLVVEVDGAIHDTRKFYDANRDAYLVRKGYKVLRFKNEELHSLASSEAVVDQIAECMGR